MKRTRVLIADDHNMVLDAFKHLIENEFEVVGTASDGRSLIKAAAELKPDVIVLDISMPLLNGLDAGRRLKQLAPSVKLVYVTMDQDADLAAQAFRNGASGYLLKNSSASELPKAIREVAMGRSYVTPLVTEGMVGSFLRRPGRSKGTRKLTARQREVVQLLAEGSRDERGGCHSRHHPAHRRLPQVHRDGAATDQVQRRFDPVRDQTTPGGGPDLRTRHSPSRPIPGR